MSRVNEVLREILAEELELVSASDTRLELVTVTAVSCEPDLRHATVLLASLSDPVRDALAEVRPRLQAAIAHQVRMKRTPQLVFQADPAVGHGQVVEEILAGLRSRGELTPGEPEPDEASPDHTELDEAGPGDELAEAGPDGNALGADGEVAVTEGESAGRDRPEQ
jgi:ribosome-binding factor A